MMKAIGYQVDFNFFDKEDGTKSCMNIRLGFKTYTEAETWARRNTIDGKVVAIFPADGWDEE